MKSILIGWLALAGTFVLIYHWDDQGIPSPARDEVGESQPLRSLIEANASEHEADPHQETQDSQHVQEKLAVGDDPLQTWFERRSKKRPNVLFIVADDMRPDIKAQVHSQSPWIFPGMHTPNLDSLSDRGLLFRRAYCQQAWCNPSRSSFLTSRRPETTMVHNNSVFFRDVNPNLVTIPQYFRQNGYLTLGMGKVFHLMGLRGDHDDDFSWSMPMYRNGECFSEGWDTWKAVSKDDRHGLQLLDEVIADFAVETLEKVAPMSQKEDQPFFVAVGLKKPHLSFVFPDEYLKYYPEENITSPINPTSAEDLPDIAWFHSFEVRGRREYKKAAEKWSQKQPLEEWAIKELRRAYWATISYVDDLVGKIIGKLEELGVADDTIISFIGDHGFHLGEQSIVGKNTNFEVANNSPMILRVPGLTDKGLITDKLVEFVDLFPTLADLAGLPSVPQCPPGTRESQQTDLCTEGSSLVPLLRDQESSRWKDRVFYQYPHYVDYSWCMGFTVRTAKYRFTEWVSYDYKETGADWNKICGTELFDHEVDPNETKNLANDASLTKTIQELRSQLKGGWSEAVPS
ncbi:hypothetical protein CAPTEDRAFT_174794 [Capitella teleta]|uniref:Sulfatase N-terminal domain-containing protein n=1 Tax=Capitella teleta TaxID=283909 RepID=R7UW13_CAPTE|nr:hypothetical protein CAPTEDRAFT_174794 [Capitella teleta]|eukprot:ELU10818.1 hypothetical protein CAPTEDRAFT_174794 [Capitella teleta]